MIPPDTHLQIGSLLFEGLDQIDLTGPFEVLSRVPNSTYRVYAPRLEPVRDVRGLRMLPDATLAEAPRLDVLHVPGGQGQEALMRDAAVLGWIRDQAAGASHVLSVCTGALLLGAAGLLVGRRATTYWNAVHLLPLFGAEPVDERVVLDRDADGRRWVFAAGVTAGIDGALRLAAELRGDEAARTIRALEDQTLAGVPILAMTANAFKEDCDKALEAGMNGHIAKPIDAGKMFQTITELLAKSNA